MIYIIAGPTSANVQAIVDHLAGHGEEAHVVKDAHDFWNTNRPRALLLQGYEQHPDIEAIRYELRCRMARVEYA